MRANHAICDYKEYLFRILRRIKRYRKIVFSPVSRPLSFFIIKLKVSRENRKNGLDGYGGVACFK